VQLVKVIECDLLGDWEALVSNVVSSTPLSLGRLLHHCNSESIVDADRPFFIVIGVFGQARSPPHLVRRCRPREERRCDLQAVQYRSVEVQAQSDSAAPIGEEKSFFQAVTSHHRPKRAK
jgi:hypothetical protein